MKQEEFLTQIVQFLEVAGIPFMLAGSLSSSYHGQPRATNDFDLVIDPTTEQLDQFLELLGSLFYVSPDAAREALAKRAMFNIIDFTDGWKADLIVRKNRPFSEEEMRRRQMGQIHGRSMPIASPEDVVLSKLEWNRISPSDRQLSDAWNVIVAQGPKLDRSYMRKWAPSLGVTDQLEELLRQADNEKATP
jgi:hypothetical protein